MKHPLVAFTLEYNSGGQVKVESRRGPNVVVGDSYCGHWVELANEMAQQRCELVDVGRDETGRAVELVFSLLP